MLWRLVKQEPRDCHKRATAMILIFVNNHRGYPSHAIGRKLIFSIIFLNFFLCLQDIWSFFLQDLLRWRKDLRECMILWAEGWWIEFDFMAIISTRQNLQEQFLISRIIKNVNNAKEIRDYPREDQHSPLFYCTYSHLHRACKSTAITMDLLLGK